VVRFPPKEVPLKEITQRIVSVLSNFIVWHKIYEAEVWTYLGALDRKEGLLINFHGVCRKERMR
jgi:hypothetical protein